MDRRGFLRSSAVLAVAPAAVFARFTRRVEPTGTEHPANFIDFAGVRGYLGTPTDGFIRWDGDTLEVVGRA